MKHLILSLVFLFSIQLKSQTVTSTCSGSSLLVQKYMKDASRLALRHSYHVNSTYTDSVHIDPVLRNTYLQALLAVYNCTLPVCDTVADTLDLHTNPGLELNTLQVDANPSNTWMQHFQSGIVPTGYAPIDNLMSRYHLGIQTYYQASQYDVAVLHTDTNYNMTALAAKFAAEVTVLGSSPNMVYDDTKNITDSINPAFTLLSYSYGWGTCQNGCDFRSYWAFKVYASDCHIEYMGHAGDNLVKEYTGIKENTAELGGVTFYPNPASSRLNLLFAAPPSSAVELQVSNLLGQEVLHQTVNGNCQVDLSEVNSGIYFVKLRYGAGSRTVKLIKQ